MENKPKFLIYHFFSQPIVDFVDHIKEFLKYGIIFSAFFTLLSFVFSQTYLCLTTGTSYDIDCSTNLWEYVCYFAIKLFVLSVYFKIWYDAVYLKKNINVLYFKENKFAFVKIFGGLIAFLALNFVPAISAFLLIMRVPNPVWQIELVYFTVVALGFLVPFFVMIFYSNIAEFIEGERCSNFKKSWQQVKSKISKVAFAVGLLGLFCFLIFTSVNRALRVYAFLDFGLDFYNLYAEFIFELILLLIVTLLVNFIRVQKQYFD